MDARSPALSGWNAPNPPSRNRDVSLCIGLPGHAVGEGLLDYLQNDRPPGAFPEVFLTCRAPYHPWTASTSLSEIVARRLRAADIDLASRGAHAFRHGFATRMVAHGHSLKAVADVLGHRHLSTTFQYTKGDFQALQAVALDWPEEEKS